MGEEIRVSMWQAPSGRWHARTLGDRPAEVSAASREVCVQRLRARLAPGEAAVLLVEVLPRLVGVAEAAEIMGWDKRRVITYVDRGRFPEPVAHLAAGRVWRRADVEAYAAAWRSRRAGRG